MTKSPLTARRETVRYGSLLWSLEKNCLTTSIESTKLLLSSVSSSAVIQYPGSARLRILNFVAGQEVATNGKARDISGALSVDVSSRVRSLRRILQ